MTNFLSLQEINPCMRAAGIDVQADSIGPKRLIYDHELIYCHQGTFTVSYETHSITAGEGMVLIIPPHISHRLDYRHAREVYWVHLDFYYHNDQDNLARYIAVDKGRALSPEGYAPTFARPQLLIRPNHKLPQLYEIEDKKSTRCIFLALIDLFESKPYNWPVSTKALLNQLLAETLLHLTSLDEDNSGANGQLSQSIMNYLRENAHRQITGEELANRFHYHQDTLGRYFKEETGITIKDFRHQLRLDKIKHLLSETDLTLEQIAEEVHMTDRSHLTRFFKAHTDMTPGCFRSDL